MREHGVALPNTEARQHGQSLVEFALALVIFLTLVFGVIEAGLLLTSYVTMQSAVAEAARYAVTGEGAELGAGTRESSIEDLARLAARTLPINASAFANQPGYFDVSIRSSGSGSSPGSGNDAGRANEFVRVVIQFNHPAFTWLLGGDGAFVPLTTEALVINERFARPTGQLGVLPPVPVPTSTPSGPVYTLVLGVAEGTGTVTASPPPNFGSQYRAGTLVTLTANPSDTFIGWVGDASGGRITTVTMNSNKTALARFSSSVYSLNVAQSGDCTGTVNPSVGAHAYTGGETVSVSATGNSTCTFAGWSGALSGTTNPGTLVMNRDASVTALFGKNTYTLTVYKVGGGDRDNQQSGSGRPRL